jgi:hypothetical protein
MAAPAIAGTHAIPDGACGDLRAMREHLDTLEHVLGREGDAQASLTHGRAPAA